MDDSWQRVVYAMCGVGGGCRRLGWVRDYGCGGSTLDCRRVAGEVQPLARAVLDEEGRVVERLHKERHRRVSFADSPWSGSTGPIQRLANPGVALAKNKSETTRGRAAASRPEASSNAVGGQGPDALSGCSAMTATNECKRRRWRAWGRFDVQTDHLGRPSRASRGKDGSAFQLGDQTWRWSHLAVYLHGDARGSRSARWSGRGPQVTARNEHVGRASAAQRVREGAVGSGCVGGRCVRVLLHRRGGAGSARAGASSMGWDGMGWRKKQRARTGRNEPASDARCEPERDTGGGL